MQISGAYRPSIVTIGAYGWTESTWIDALQASQTELLCDIRYRRGVRGSEYRFVNSNYLQRILAEVGLAYVHRKDLAPPPSVRLRQTFADQRLGQRKRARLLLDPAFTQAYQQECLAGLSAQAFLNSLAGKPKVICLFCVEREPLACHRSLLSSVLATALNVEVDHLVP